MSSPDSDNEYIDQYFEALDDHLKEPWNKFVTRFPKPNSSSDSNGARHHQTIKQIYCMAAETADPEQVAEKSIFEIINARLSQHGEGKDLLIDTNVNPTDKFGDIELKLEFQKSPGKWFLIIQILGLLQGEKHVLGREFIAKLL